MTRGSRWLAAAAVVGAVTFAGSFAARTQIDAYVHDLLVRSNPEIDEEMIRRLHSLDLCIGRTVRKSTECRIFRGLRNAQWAGLALALAGAGGLVAARRRS